MMSGKIYFCFQNEVWLAITFNFIQIKEREVNGTQSENGMKCVQFEVYRDNGT